MLINLTEQEAELLRRTVEVELEELSHETHHTRDREFRGFLEQKEHVLVEILAKLGGDTKSRKLGMTS
jgi:hypothetical protein